MSSTFWIFIIILGGSAVVLGNIEYAKAKASEETIEIAANAKSILFPELLANHQLAFKIIAALQNKELPHSMLSTGAWQVASQGNMITSLPEHERLAIVETYQHILNANEHHNRFIEINSGVASALEKSGDTKKVIESNLIFELNNVIEKSQPLLTSKKSPNKSSNSDAASSAGS